MSDARNLFDRFRDEIYAWVRRQLQDHRQDLGQTTGVMPGRQLPTTGNTGAGYTPAAHASSHEDGGTDALDLGSIAGELTDTQHGDRAGGTLHDVASGSVAGFMSAADKAKEDLYPDVSGLTPGDVLTALTSSTVGFAPPSAGSGTVTSVALTAPAELDVSGSPVTTSGTLALTWANATANRVLAGPTTGSPGTPAFRALVAGDIPNLPESQITGLVSDLSALATGIADTYTKSASDARYAPISVVGSVTSVGLALPSLFSVSGSPVTGSGTLTGAFASQSANTVLAGPTSGGAATPTMRALVAGDIPNPLNATGIRTAIGANAAGLYVPWITGDTLATSRFGASTSGNNQVAVYANSDSGTAINAISNSGAGFYGQSSTGVPLQGARTSSLTNAVANVLSFAHNTSGTAAAGLGAGIRFRLQSSTTPDQDAAQIAALWTDATHATRTTAITFSTVNSASALTERMRLTGAGLLGIGTTLPTTMLHLHSTSLATLLRLSSLAPGIEFQDDAVVASRTVAGFFGLSTANGHYNALKGDLNFGALSFAAGNSNAINFLTPTNDAGGYVRRLIITRAGYVGVGGTIPTTDFEIQTGVLTAGFWQGDAIGATEIEILPAGAILYSIVIVSVNLRDSSGNVNNSANTRLTVPGSSFDSMTITTVSPTTMTIRLYSTGRLTILRTAGSTTSKVGIVYNGL